jgi:hypothetical protein
MTRPRAVAAAEVLTGVAACAAVVTKIAAAPVAAGGVVWVAVVTALTAGHPGPFVETNVGACAVVGSERLGHDREEVQQPPLAESSAQGCGGFALAELVVADVGMRDGIVDQRARRLQRDDAIGEPLVKPRDVQHDLERAERDALQSHRLGGHGDLPGLKVDAQLGELELEGDEVVIDVAGGGQSRWRGLVKFHPYSLQGPAQVVQPAGQFPATRLASVPPAALLRHRQEFRGADAGDPRSDGRSGELRRRRRAARERRRSADKQPGIVHRHPREVCGEGKRRRRPRRVSSPLRSWWA